MSRTIYNTQTCCKEAFVTLDLSKVSMYCCGVTEQPDGKTAGIVLKLQFGELIGVNTLRSSFCLMRLSKIALSMLR